MTTAIATTATSSSVRAFRAAQGCQAHLVVDEATRTGLVIDPRLDQVDEIIQAAVDGGVRIQYVVDTHTHADHLSGVRHVAARAGATLLAHPGSKVIAQRVLEDGENFHIGETEVRVMHSPGHTPDSLSLLVDGHLFTGDALFAGSAGRTDFMGGSASDLYDSFRRFETLPDETIVHPGHDYTGHPTTTIGAERRGNELMMETDRQKLISRLDIRAALPANMKDILSFNAKGPSDSYVSPLELDATRRMREGELIVDVRSPSEFRSAHIEEATNIPIGEFQGRMTEIPKNRDIVLLCQSGVRSQEAARALRQTGRTARQLEGGMVAWQQHNLPTTGRGNMSVERQVQLTVGSGVVLGSVLGALVSPLFLVIPAFMGAGLVVAGASGTCGLALVLAKLPWNRHEDEEASACAATTNSACAATPSSACAADDNPAATDTSA